MATTPLYNERDGSGTTLNLAFTTNREFITLSGVIDLKTVDVQVSINGANFVSDPTLVLLDTQSFAIPNPNSLPDGITLEIGETTIQVRAIDIVGSVSAVATATITRVAVIDSAQTTIPSGIELHRFRDYIEIHAAVPNAISVSGNYSGSNYNYPFPGQPTFLGFNIYAGTAPAGVAGYFRVNDVPVASPTVTTKYSNPVANGTFRRSTTGSYLRTIVQMEDEVGNVQEVLYNVRDIYNIFDGDVQFDYNYTNVKYYPSAVFKHIRSGGPNIVNSDQFSGVSDDASLYYVVTAVYYNPITKVEYETPYSQEVLGAPLVIDTSIRDLPGRTQYQITVDYITAVQRAENLISLIPGSTTRDVSIDPFASEAERLWFILDFVHRCQSFLTLLQIDDPGNTGSSDDPATSTYKQALKNALGYTTDSSVQSLIDTQFDKLAANENSYRLAGRNAVGQVVAYTTSKPTKDISIPSGTTVSTNGDATTPTQRYTVGGTYIMSAANAESYYNFSTKRYEITLDITCTTIGLAGNRPAGQITNISGVSGISVTNTEATVFGLDRETNNDLAARTMLAFLSVDAGTEGGYAKTAAAQPGIIKAKIVKSGDTLMMRDWDPIRKKHIGGKVDIWTQGLREAQVTDRFAFTFEIARDIQCDIVDIPTLKFRVRDSRVTPDTPIVEILDNPSQSMGVRNVTTGQDYNLAGVIIDDFETFHLNTALVQPTTMTDDVIVADYRFRVVHAFTFSMQPVRRVTSVVGEVSGALIPDTGYNLYKTEDPLLNGESTIAQDHLVITQVGGIPSGATIAVNDEQHVMIGFFQELLGSIGINTLTIRVFNQERTKEYAGPTAAVPDFEIIEGTPTSPAQIIRTTESAILNGQTVSVDYTHDENFTVSYVINDLLQELQKSVDVMKHITADVLVKQSIDNSIVIETTVQLKQGAKKDTVDPDVRTNVSTELNQRYIGQGIAQSDVIHAIDATTGVDFQVVPMVLMAYADGSRKIRESISNASELIPSLDIGGNRAFILNNTLEYPTVDHGGLDTEHHGVFQDDVAMTMVTVLTNVCLAAYQAYIIGSSGSVIIGYSDDATLISQGFTTQAAIQAERLALTANHVVLSLPGTTVPPDEPLNHSYAVSYVVRGDSGSHDISSSDIEFLDLGNMTITYRTA
jgi:hypothetical protein